MMRFGMAICVLCGLAFCLVPLQRPVLAETIKGESHDRKMTGTGTQQGNGGGGAGKVQSMPKKKMLNPQPEPPGRR
jgi:hypothetical protein